MDKKDVRIRWTDGLTKKLEERMDKTERRKDGQVCSDKEFSRREKNGQTGSDQLCSGNTKGKMGWRVSSDFKRKLIDKKTGKQKRQAE